MPDDRRRERALLQIRVELEAMMPERSGSWGRRCVTCRRCGMAVTPVGVYTHYRWHKEQLLHATRLYETVAAIWEDA